MTAPELKLTLPDRLAREAQAAGPYLPVHETGGRHQGAGIRADNEKAFCGRLAGCSHTTL